MKKFFCFIFFVLVSCNAVHASYWNPSDEVKALRTVKNAKIKVINSQIKEKTEYIQQVTLDDTLSDEEKNTIYLKEQEELKSLHKQKRAIEKQYKKDKRYTKFPWKYFKKKN